MHTGKGRGPGFGRGKTTTTQLFWPSASMRPLPNASLAALASVDNCSGASAVPKIRGALFLTASRVRDSEIGDRIDRDIGGAPQSEHIPSLLRAHPTHHPPSSGEPVAVVADIVPPLYERVHALSSFLVTSCISAADNASTGANRVHLEPALHGPGRPLPTGEGLAAAGGLNDTAEDGAAAGPPGLEAAGGQQEGREPVAGRGAGDLVPFPAGIARVMANQRRRAAVL
ncbi:hypothetical protein OIDMADRAFT_25412 [Oidiodendron maius Zn]|uniref:Uncharacterized protein n=1 Tax=Oidiodendron maius (strain Zn) TaxID=913774 RepID=A0A0C3DRV3_OIDMZ|nr:hypothetical protein OIDMADRAFT_25412 [Oidiodendron maius Zn]